MVKRIVPGALALALTLTLIACPGGKDPEPGSGGLSFADFCAESTSVVEAEIACLHGDPAALGTTMASCSAAFEAEVTAGRLTYRGDRARRCLDAAKTATCEAFAAGLPECEAVLTGTVPNGSACLVDHECANGHCRVEASCPGVCTPFVALDGDCTAASAACAPDLYCGPGGRCLAPPATMSAQRGQPCVAGACAGGLYCDPATSTCAPQKTSGASNAPDACAYASVDDICVPLVGRGERCGSEALCGPGWACDQGTCAPAPGLGSPCTVSYGSDCVAGAYCDTSGTPSTCRAQKPGGAACSTDMECQSYACTAGTCELRLRKCLQ